MNRGVIILSLIIFPYYSMAHSLDNPISRKVIQRSNVLGSNSELQMILVEYQPGAEAPAHIHPVQGLNYIIEGTAESQYKGETIKTFHAGDSYQDEANKKHLIFRNVSKTNKLKFLVACKIQKGLAFTRSLAVDKK